MLKDNYYCSNLDASHNYEVYVDSDYYILHDLTTNTYYKFFPQVDIRNFHIVQDSTLVQDRTYEPCEVSNSIFTSVNSYKLVIIFLCIFYLAIKVINLGSVALIKGGFFGDI